MTAGSREPAPASVMGPISNTYGGMVPFRSERWHGDVMFTRRTNPVVARLGALGLPRPAADQLSMAGTLVSLPAGTILCREGERGMQAFLLLEGTADVQLTDHVVTVGPGEVIGELATLDWTRTRNATVVAASDVLVLVFDAGTYRSLARDEALRHRLAPERAAA